MQSMQRRVVYITVLLLGLVWIAFSVDRSGASTNGRIPAPRAGFLAPEFALQTMDGETVSLASLRGQAVLVNIWASWCMPCRAEMPAMQRVYEEYKADGLVVLAVNSTVQDSADRAASFVQELGLTFPIVLDVEGKATGLYQVSALPSSFFVGRDGVIVEVVIGGPMSEALLRTRVEKILETQP